MHMPQRPIPASILAPEVDGCARRLWQSLQPQAWPVPPQRLPACTALVGGAVRDGLLGRLPERPDLDLVVPDDAIALARGLQRQLGGTCVVLDRERSIARLVLRGWTLDLARCEGETLELDLRRRDFTVNAIALPLAPMGGGAGLVDPTDGLKDLAARRLVAVSEANLLADPLRMLRGLRLAAELDFGLEATTLGWIGRHSDRLATVAGERVLAELERLATAQAGESGLLRALETGLLRPWSDVEAPAGLPRLDRDGAARRGLDPAETVAALRLARLAAVLDERALAALPLSRRTEHRCRQLRRWGERLRLQGIDRLEGLGEDERILLQQQLEEDLPALLVQLDPAGARAALARWRDRQDPLFHPRPPIDGARLQRELDLQPGPLLGRLLQHLLRERAFGRLPDPSGGGDAVILAAARRWLATAEVSRRD
jgi:tRNA nucleotidyltransferase (CCA-adding enzyme)